MGVMGLGAFVALMLVAGVQAEAGDERLYGRVTTAGGEVLQGFLRWDNQVGWSDFLEGTKEIPWEHRREREELDPAYGRAMRRERSLEAFGVRITWDRDDTADPLTVSSAVRFAHIASIVVLDNRRVRLTLRDGEEVVLEAATSHLGGTLRGLVVDDPSRGEIALRRRDLDRIDFLPAPAGERPLDRRLHGTVVTKEGVELTGFVAWDRDEAFASDVLDGDAVDDGATYEIAFAEIAAIEWVSARSARVVLRDGSEVVLRGTNDVDRDNRGIEIADPAFGRAVVSWEAFDAVTFHERRAAPAAYADFTLPGSLSGTVRTSAGDVLEGRIRWDNDEAWGWEVLDGWMDDVAYDVELRSVRSIVRGGGTGAEVTLLDGRVLMLTRSNDVDRGNQGIFVTDDRGRTTLVKWDDFEEVTFAW